MRGSSRRMKRKETDEEFCHGSRARGYWIVGNGILRYVGQEEVLIKIGIILACPYIVH
jgi:hypothetical protein